MELFASLACCGRDAYMIPARLSGLWRCGMPRGGAPTPKVVITHTRFEIGARGFVVFPHGRQALRSPTALRPAHLALLRILSLPSSAGGESYR